MCLLSAQEYAENYRGPLLQQLVMCSVYRSTNLFHAAEAEVGVQAWQMTVKLKVEMSHILRGET